jgi:hypothetical protein
LLTCRCTVDPASGQWGREATAVSASSPGNFIFCPTLLCTSTICPPLHWAFLFVPLYFGDSIIFPFELFLFYFEDLGNTARQNYSSRPESNKTNEVHLPPLFTQRGGKTLALTGGAAARRCTSLQTSTHPPLAAAPCALTTAALQLAARGQIDSPEASTTGRE